MTQKEFNKAVGEAFKGFYLPKQDKEYSLIGWYAVALMGVWDEVFDSRNNLTSYVVIGQHGAVSRDYSLECKKKSFKWVQENYPRLIEDIYSIYNN